MILLNIPHFWERGPQVQILLPRPTLSSISTPFRPRKSGLYILRPAEFCCKDFEAESGSRRFDLFRLQRRVGNFDIGYDRQAPETGDHLAQQLKTRGREIGGLI